MSSEIPITTVLQQLNKLPLIAQSARYDITLDPVRSDKFNEDCREAQRDCEDGHKSG